MSVAAPAAEKTVRCPTCRADHACGSACNLFISAECPVCLETRDPFVSLPCKHGVCAECYPQLCSATGRAPVAAVLGTSDEGNVVLDESIDENWEPTPAEVREYAVWLGMTLPADDAYLYIAKEGLKAPLPPPWKPCKTSEGEIFYFNFSTGESVWDHPCDEFYRQQYASAKADAEAKAAKQAQAQAARAQAIAEMEGNMDTFLLDPTQRPAQEPAQLPDADAVLRRAKKMTRKAELGDVAAALGEARKLLANSKAMAPAAAAQTRAARGAGERRRRSVEKRPSLDIPPPSSRTLPPLEGGARRATLPSLA